VLKLVLLGAVILFAVAIVQVIALKDRRPWPRKPHLGHWRKWDEDDQD